MELLQLRYFCDAAVSQNFSKTARKYLVPTSNISQSVKRLERELGCELFEHRSNKIFLNDDGKKFFSAASEALSLLENAKAALTDREGEIFGEIKITCLCNRSTLTDAVERFTMLYPQVNFVMNHTSGGENDFDILISDSCPIEYESRILLVDEEICLAVNRDHPLAERELVSAEELVGERFITMATGSSLHNITVSTCNEAGFTPNIAIQTDDPFYIRKYIERGLGIAFVPSFSWRRLFSDNVSLKSVGNIRRKTYAYLPRNKRVKRSVEVFLEVFKETIRN